MLLHVGHILEGVIFLYAPPLVLVLEEMFKDFVPQLIPLRFLEGGKVVFIIGLKNMVEVLSPSLAPIIGDTLKRVFRSLRAATTLVLGASRC